MQSSRGRSFSARRSLSQLYLVLAWLFAGALVVQVFLAGLNVFGQPLWWGAHIQLGHALGGLALLLALLSFVGRFPRGMRWLSLGLIVLFALQYNARLLAWLLGLPQLAALHAANAVLLFWAAVTLGRWAWQLSRRESAGDS